MDQVHTNGSIRRSDVEKNFQVSPSTATRMLRSLMNKGFLRQEGKGRALKYVSEPAGTAGFTEP